MSNQTFVKKDRISFAQNLNETIVIAPSNITTNALYIGPNSAITYDGDSNVQNIDYLQGVTLSNQYIYADGTYLSNLPNGITQNNLTSTITGLGTFGYISTATGGGVTQNNLTSTIIGLGAFGYISSSQLYSTVQGINSYVSSFIDPVELSSTIIGIVTPDFVSSIGFTSSIISSLSGLGNLGYISSSQLQSTVRGLGNTYLSTNSVPSTIVGLGTFGYISSSQLQSTVVGLLEAPELGSTIVGLGTFGYISSTQLFSTTRGLGNTYLSTNSVPSTIVGLGTFGYISSTQLQSTVRGLGNVFNFTGSTNFISSGQGYFSSLNVDSLVLGNGTGWLDLTALRAILVSTIQIDAAIGNFSSISGNGSQIVGVNAISTPSLQSTLVGLGTFGYISSSQLQSTVVGLLDVPELGSTITGLGTFGYISSSQLQSTVVGLLDVPELGSTITGLGTFGYISTPSLQSTVRGLGNIYMSTFTGSTNFISSSQGFISSLNVNSLVIGNGAGWVDFGALRAVIISTIQINTGNLFASSITGDGSQIYNIQAVSSLSLQSTIRGLGTFGYISSSQLQSTVVGLLDAPELGSTIVGLGTFGYISSSQLQSTVTGLLDVPELGSTITGLGTFGYISSSQLQSTVTGLLDAPELGSTIVGLGTFGYISSSQLQSTVRGLGNIFSFTGSTNFISSGQGYFSSLNVDSLVLGNGTGWLDLTALRAILVSTVQIDAAIGNFSSISGNGSQIVNLNAISTPSLQSTLVGLGTFGYISSSQLQSTVTGLLDVPELGSTIVGLGTFGYISSTQLFSTTRGLGNIYLSTNIVPSTIVGLGTFGYISSSQLQSTVVGLLDVPELGSTIVGLGTFGYISSSQLQSTVVGLLDVPELGSTIVGLGTFGYISSTQLFSTTRGLGNIYLSTNIVPSTIVGLGTFGYISSSQLQSTVVGLLDVPELGSTIVGLGTFGYISSSQLQSTVTGLGSFGYLSTNSVPSTIVGLGTFGYISSSQLQSTVVGLLDAPELGSTIVGLGTFRYLSSFNSISSLNISTGNFFANIANTSTLSNTDGIFTNSISTANAFSATLFFSTAQGYQISTNRIVGDTRTNNLYPLTTGAIVGYGSLTGDLGFYNEGHFRSTFTQVIQPSLDNDSFSNVVRINGNISSQNIFVSSIFGRIISTNTLATNNLVGVGVGNAIYSQNFHPVGVNILGFGTGGPGNGPWDSASIRFTQTSSIVTNNISTGVAFISSLNVNSLVFGTGLGWIDFGAVRTLILSSLQVNTGVLLASSINGDGSQIYNLPAISSLSLQSTVRGLGTLSYISSTQLQSTVTGLVDHPELTSTVTGLGIFGYLSTNSVPSTIVGLGTFGYISSTQLQSTVRKLETYFSIITLSTNANLSVSSLTFVEINTNSTASLYYRSSMIYVGNNILYGALQYTPQFISF